jgi:hypothetical protein
VRFEKRGLGRRRTKDTIYVNTRYEFSLSLNYFLLLFCNNSFKLYLLNMSNGEERHFVQLGYYYFYKRSWIFKRFFAVALY